MDTDFNRAFVEHWEIYEGVISEKNGRNTPARRMRIPLMSPLRTEMMSPPDSDMMSLPGDRCRAGDREVAPRGARGQSFKFRIESSCCGCGGGHVGDAQRRPSWSAGAASCPRPSRLGRGRGGLG